MIHPTRLLDMARRFAVGEVVIEIAELGNGLINDTYRVETDARRFVLQRINAKVFPAPSKIQDNLLLLDAYIARSDIAQAKLRLPTVITTHDGAKQVVDSDGHLWRALSYIENTYSPETIGAIAEAEQAGFALGHFHRLFSDLPEASLHDTLPGFHIAPAYFRHYRQVLKTQQDFEVSEKLRYCIDFIARHQLRLYELERAKLKGHLKVRVIHGDPKLNNFLFDRDTHRVVSLIDLDTVKPGLVHYDIGDCLRSLCQREEKAEFDLDICGAVLKNYLSEAKAFFTEYDYRYLFPAIRLIPFELGLRFFTDHLEGNRYFKTSEPGRNLQRAIDQFKLCESIMAKQTAIEKLIDGLAGS